MKICIEYVGPPIPTRSYDYQAWIDGEEESRRYGYGKTEMEALQDWIDQYGEDR